MITFQLNANSGVPIYRQIQDQIRYGIASGLLESGEQLPTVRARPQPEVAFLSATSTTPGGSGARGFLDRRACGHAPDAKGIGLRLGGQARRQAALQAQEREARLAASSRRQPVSEPDPDNPASPAAASTSQCASPCPAVSEPGNRRIHAQRAADRNAACHLPRPSCPLEQRQAWPQDNQHVTIQAGEIPRVSRLFESPMAHTMLPASRTGSR